MAEYFIYCKEVLNLVAAKRSVATDKFIRVITANDLSGISLTGDATFRKALSASSKKATDLVCIYIILYFNLIYFLSKTELICSIPHSLVQHFY